MPVYCLYTRKPSAHSKGAACSHRRGGLTLLEPTLWTAVLPPAWRHAELATLLSSGPSCSLLLTMAQNGSTPAAESHPSAEGRVAHLKLDLPPAPKAMGVYKPVLV